MNDLMPYAGKQRRRRKRVTIADAFDRSFEQACEISRRHSSGLKANITIQTKAIELSRVIREQKEIAEQHAIKPRPQTRIRPTGLMPYAGKPR